MPDSLSVRRHQAMMKLDAATAELADINGVDPLEAMARARRDWELEERIEPFDFLDGFMNGVKRTLPTVGHLDDGRGLFYRGKVNTLFGDDAAGKSLMTDAIAIQEVQAGNGVMILECEEYEPSSRQERWIEMSNQRTLITEEHVRRLTVWPITKQIAPKMLQTIVDTAERENCSLIIIDSLADLMGKYGLEENSNTDIRRIENELLKPLAKTGAALIVIDHVGKDSDGKFARGSSTKRHFVSGVAYELANPEGYEFDRETAGFSVLTTRKDRGGNYRRHKPLGVMRVTPALLNNGVLKVELYDDPAREEDVEPPVVHERTLAVINGESITDQQRLDIVHELIVEERLTMSGVRRLTGWTKPETERVLQLGVTAGLWTKDGANRWNVLRHVTIQ